MVNYVIYKIFVGEGNLVKFVVAKIYGNLKAIVEGIKLANQLQFV